jgi:cystathionine beta-lyase
VKAQGTYLSWLDCTGLAQRINTRAQAEAESKKTGKHVAPEAMLQKWFVYNAKVDLNPGNTYGAGGEDHMRMNIATSRKTLQLALDNITNALKSKATM